ncbi:MAG: hypothetical protein IPG72_14425 [Ardenticatenales bacterium]|nr:hypothetical protein [Ardenticatenales bacterium]
MHPAPGPDPRQDRAASPSTAFQYHTDDDEEILSFVEKSTIPTPDGGTHVSGFRAALTRRHPASSAGRKS